METERGQRMVESKRRKETDHQVVYKRFEGTLQKSISASSEAFFFTCQFDYRKWRFDSSPNLRWAFVLDQLVGRAGTV